MIPYFSMLNTNASILIFIISMFALWCFSSAIATMAIKRYSFRLTALWGFAGIFWFIFLSWVFIGDPVWWYIPIGTWLKQ